MSWWSLKIQIETFGAVDPFIRCSRSLSLCGLSVLRICGVSLVLFCFACPSFSVCVFFLISPSLTFSCLCQAGARQRAGGDGNVLSAWRVLLFIFDFFLSVFVFFSFDSLLSLPGKREAEGGEGGTDRPWQVLPPLYRVRLQARDALQLRARDSED